MQYFIEHLNPKGKFENYIIYLLIPSIIFLFIVAVYLFTKPEMKNLDLSSTNINSNVLGTESKLDK